MKSLTHLFPFLVPVAALAVESAVSYYGHQVFRVPVTDDGSHIQSVIDKLKVNIWQPPTRKGAFADVQVAPSQLEDFRKAMEGHQLITMHEDLGKSILEEGTYKVYAAGSANGTWFESYHSYKDHLRWLYDLENRYSKNAMVVTSGNSLEGNPITGLHIFGTSGGGKKPAIVLHGTVHAREWIASMVIEYMINELTTKYGSDNEITSFVDKYDFYLFPIVNVDGFKFSQTTDRMWRKNRQTTTGSNCLGLDINRNWPYMWDQPGSSTNPCGETFRGSSEGDAPETRALSKFLQDVKNAQGLKLYIDIHSYSQLFMTPYGYSCDAKRSNDDELQSLAKGATDAIYSVHNVRFEYGPICTTVYQASGNSVDYVADVVQADYTFAAELRDTGEYGFVLPPDQIIPSGEEAFAGIKYLLQNMK
ncbi:carboxypeptidase [Metarhizium rileyi]|uniref:Carboxypeptidase M14A n=1 Tax=Metarhizium rileyi (strain RCEF 4871) TaxID=1649241 RepID=A0A166VZV7_METRR|nr:carboxypeptidase [Metarhizium rileyi RCEF 4871]